VTVVVNGIIDEEEADAATIELVNDEQAELAAEA
jgi:hypothetical protein